MARELMLGLDQGTGSSRAILVDRRGRVHAQGQAAVGRREHRDGSIDQDAEACFRSLRKAVREALASAEVKPAEVVGAGLAVQRSTSVLYSAGSPKPLAPAISWQCQRTRARMDRLTPTTRRRLQEDTGLPAVPSYAASKLQWLVEHHRPTGDDWRHGTLDSYLVARLADDARPATDLSQATRTLLVALGEHDWSTRHLAPFGLERERLPRIVDTIGEFARLRRGALSPLPSGLPLLALAGDQQAALYAATARRVGEAKITYGSGAFLLAPAGPEVPGVADGLLRSVAWSRRRARGGSTVEYLLEANVPSAGTVIAWLERTLGQSFSTLLRRVSGPNWDQLLGDAICVPAFAGLGPLQPELPAGGAFFGLRHDHRPSELALSLAVGIAASLAAGLDAVEGASPRRLRSLVADGGGSRDPRFLQLQADLFGRPLARTLEAEATAYGAAALAWTATGDPPPPLRRAAPRRPRISAARARCVRRRFQRATEALRDFGAE